MDAGIICVLYCTRILPTIFSLMGGVALAVHMCWMKPSGHCTMHSVYWLRQCRTAVSSGAVDGQSS